MQSALRRLPPQVFLVGAALLIVYAVVFSPAGGLVIPAMTGGLAAVLAAIGVWRLARP